MTRLVTEVYPPDDGEHAPLVRGDDWTIPVTLRRDTEDGEVIDPADGDRDWAATVRRSPGDPAPVAVFTVVVDRSDEAVPRLLLLLPEAESSRTHDGDGLSLQTTGPVKQTWWIVRRLRIEGDYTQ